ncbi:fluoride efflux transporter CrcB [Virgibacillus xinjiangensis]|uniref:Fluoride-specific ion channel FluC n=1 Tax=Virgibacillus xinjiangensis TaxID=393090 RepID=A0ABV7CVK1_9BACI
MRILWVMIGGFFGSVARYGLGEWISIGGGFPLGTLMINLIGCFLLGWFLTIITQRSRNRQPYMLVIGTGFIGSFTTFSTFSVESVELLKADTIWLAVFYITGSIIGGLWFAYTGYRLAGRKGDRP